MFFYLFSKRKRRALGSKKSPCFPEMLSLIPIALQSYSKTKYHVARFDKRRCFFIFFKLPQIPSGYALSCMFLFPCLSGLREIKQVLALTKIFRFDPGSSIHVLSNKIEKMFHLSMVLFYLGRSCRHLYPVKRY